LAAQDGAIAGKAALPQSVTEQQRAGGAVAVFGGAKDAPQERLDFQHGQHVAGDRGDVEPFRVARTHQVDGVAVVGA
jgi:hypothetical protein